MNIVKMISNYNFSSGTIDRLKDGYIVIHYTGTPTPAKSNCEYFAGGNRGASAHYFIDHNGDVYQCVEDKNSAWHCGATIYNHPKCRNGNSIGIELCCRTTGDPSKSDSNWYFEDATVSSAILLVKELMVKYGIPADHVIRHYDVTGKVCPAPYVFNNKKHTWSEFLTGIKNVSTGSLSFQNGGVSQTDAETVGWNVLISAGFPAVSVAGIMGNLKAESGLKANNLQNSYESLLGFTDESYTAAVDSGSYSKERFYKDCAGYGLAQWTYWSRKKEMYEYIVDRLKKSIGDVNAQFDFLVHELTTSYSELVMRLKACSTIREASDLVLTQYEKPANQSDSVKSTRAKYSQEIYEKFVTSTSTTNAGGSSAVSSVGTPFYVDVSVVDLNIRKGPGTNYEKTGKYTGIGRFTIVEVQPGAGSSKGWGLLKSYQTNRNGWISLDYAKRV